MSAAGHPRGADQLGTARPGRDGRRVINPKRRNVDQLGTARRAPTMGGIPRGGRDGRRVTNPKRRNVDQLGTARRAPTMGRIPRGGRDGRRVINPKRRNVGARRAVPFLGHHGANSSSADPVTSASIRTMSFSIALMSASISASGRGGTYL